MPFTGLPDVKKERLFVVLFEEVLAPGIKSRRHSGPAPRHKPSTASERRRIPKLEHELSSTNEYLQSLIEEHSRTNDDLGSANEELVSGNEELQSLNEELETAKEELQSTNEELTTVNDELNNRNVEVSEINSDLVNLLNTVEVPILILDKARRIRRFTPAARNILNVLPTDMGRQLDDIRRNIDVPDLDQQIAEAIASAVSKESDVQDSGGRWYRMQIRPYKATDGSVDGAIVSLFDIDSLKHHINEAQQAKEEAQRADQAKDQFLAVLSHELRTPLSALLMQTQLLRQGGADAAKRERACVAIERSTKMQVQLVNDLLDVSRIVTGKMKVVLEPVSMVAVVNATLDTLSALADAKGVHLRTFLDDHIGPVAGDRTRLEQVVLNLVTNAIKFTPSGGKVDVVLEQAQGLAHLRVSDSGAGIDPDFLPRIFNRLTQKDSSSTRPHGGLGLGLAIVRHLVDAHGGSVRAESAGTGQGATLHVKLPILKQQLSEPALDSETEKPPPEVTPWGREATDQFNGRRILLVEDDTTTREGLAELFTGMGASVRMADSTLQGMIGIEEFHPHLLISDLAMPIEDGFSLIRKVRALPPDKGGNTPALALTALAGEAEGRRALSEGFQAHLVKPVDLDHLVSAVSELLPKASESPGKAPEKS
jgi:two-component system CheB/CheR fusion protein